MVQSYSSTCPAETQVTAALARTGPGKVERVGAYPAMEPTAPWHEGAPRLIALIRPENARSIRVAERLGLRQVREDTLNGVRVLVFGVERPSVP